jgi:hypothetical protein
MTVLKDASPQLSTVLVELMLIVTKKGKSRASWLYSTSICNLVKCQELDVTLQEQFVDAGGDDKGSRLTIERCSFKKWILQIMIYL